MASIPVPRMVFARLIVYKVDKEASTYCMELGARDTHRAILIVVRMNNITSGCGHTQLSTKNRSIAWATDFFPRPKKFNKRKKGKKGESGSQTQYNLFSLPKRTTTERRRCLFFQRIVRSGGLEKEGRGGIIPSRGVLSTATQK